MVYLSDIMDPVLLGSHIAKGYVTARPHQSLPLTILNYSKTAQFDRVWDDVTKKCRGLIYDNRTMEIVARPFEKFFNWDESGAPYPPSGPALRMEKMDGSLGILYPVPAKSPVNFGDEFDYAVATRGSFHSEQAEWATKFFMASWENDYAGKFSPDNSKTYLFEIIYPENRIVVDYGPYRGLMLIDVIDNETGFADLQEFDDCEWPDKVVRKPVPGFDSGQTADIPDSDEGFVYLWPARNFRTKMKSAHYVHLHRLVSNLNEKTVWEQLCDGKTADDIKRDLPEEFHSFIDKTVMSIVDEALFKLARVIGATLRLQHDFDVYDLNTVPRKDLALAIKDNPDKRYIFAKVDGKDIWPQLIKDSKPVKVSATASDKEAA